MKSAVTMVQVAKAAGVHQTTVSLALRNDLRLPLETRQRIQAVAEKLGYRPNPMVSALIAQRKRGRSPQRGSVIAFLTAYPERDLWRASSNYVHVYSAMERHADDRGYKLEEFWLRPPAMTPERLRSILLYRGIRAIVVCPLSGTDQKLDFDFSQFASVALGYTMRQPQLDHVAIDYFAIMGVLTRHLIACGHRRIGFATTRNIDARVDHLSLGRFLAEKHKAPGYFRPPLMSNGWDRTELLRWMEKEKPDAVITATTTDFQTFQTWLTDAGYKIPTDLSLVNADCRTNSREAGIVQNLEEEARAAVEFVTGRAERAQFGVPVEPQTILIRGQWRDGQSFRVRKG